MLRAVLVAVLTLAAPSAWAQTAGAANVDFVLRPTQGMDEDSPDALYPGASAPTPEQPEAAPEPVPGTKSNPAAARAQSRATPVPPTQQEPPPARRLREDADPFAPTGIALGAFVIRPALEIGVDASDNAAGTARKRAAVGLVVAPEVNIQAQDKRYAVEANLHGEAVLYGDKALDERAADARIKGHYDLTGNTILQGEAGYSYYLDRYNDPNTPAAAVERPAVHQFGAKLGVTQRFGAVGVGVDGEVQREVHEDVALAGGGTASLNDLDNTEYGLRVRASYGLGRPLTPYVEAAGGRRDYDESRDSSGFARSGVWGELRGGLAFDLGAKFNGDIAVGWRHEAPEDRRLDDIDALTVAAAVIWSPRRLTELRLNLSTDVQPTSIADSPGSVLYSGTLTASRQVSARVKLEAGLGLDYEHFVDAGRDDTTYSAFAGASYALNRFASIQARYSYEQTDSTDRTANENANVIGVRVRVQH